MRPTHRPRSSSPPSSPPPQRRLVSGALLSACLLTVAACQGPPVPSEPTLTLNPSGRAPLAAVVEFTTDRPAVASLEISDGVETQQIEPGDAPSTDHELMVLGLLPGATHTVTITVTDDGGRSSVLPPLQVTTAPLPDEFPPLEIPVRRPSAMEPGLVLVPFFRWTDEPGEDDPDWGLTVAVDREGRVRWFYQPDGPVGEMRRMHNGNLFHNAGRAGLLHEIDMLGNEVRSWHTRLVKEEHIPEDSILVDTDTFHHDVIELASGNFLALSTEARFFEDWPAEYPPGEKTAPAHVIGDVIVEFRKDGSIVKEIKVLDLLDPYRLGTGSLNTSFYEEEYSDVLEKPGYDWTHSNAIVYLEDTNQVLVSSNYQAVHYVLDWASGELDYMFGDPREWKAPWSDKLLEPRSDVQWAYHQHGIEPTPQGTWILYDNGGARTVPPHEGLPNGERYSRVVEYRTDPDAGTIEQIWEYGPEQEWFMSPFISDADWLPETGNVLITDGGRMVDGEGNQLDRFGGRNWARILQVTYGDDPQKVWELVIDDPSRGYSVYRAQHIKSLYPRLDPPTG